LEQTEAKNEKRGRRGERREEKKKEKKGNGEKKRVQKDVSPAQ
jgi:hypothetical protein